MAVFADLLSVRGDPRGELVALQLERERRPSDPRLARAEAEHLARHDRALLGGLRTATSLCELTWRRGYIVEAKLRSVAQDPANRLRQRQIVEPKRARLARVVRELLALESAQQLAMLRVEQAYSSFARAHLLACADEVVLAAPPALRVLGLHLLEQRYEDRYDWEWRVAPTIQQQLGDLHVSADAAFAPQVFLRF
jgi:hypothetical protein